jgi:cyclopropane fatty-acyl-phospholipid synthase-like methyltransferase
MTDAAVNLGWESIWRAQGARWELQEPQPEVVALVDRLKAEGKRRVHDLGCGLGRHLLLLAAEGFETSGSDISPQAVTTCHRRLAEAGLSATVTRSPMTAIPEEDGSLDCLVAWHVAYHSTVDEIERTLQGVHDKLKPGGYFFATFISTGHSTYELSCQEAEQGLSQRLEDGTFIRPHDTIGDKALVHHYTTEQELRNRLLAAFEILSLEERRRDSVDDGERYCSAHWVALARKGT